MAKRPAPELVPEPVSEPVVNAAPEAAAPPAPVEAMEQPQSPPLGGMAPAAPLNRRHRPGPATASANNLGTKTAIGIGIQRPRRPRAGRPDLAGAVRAAGERDPINRDPAVRETVVREQRPDQANGEQADATKQIGKKPKETPASPRTSRDQRAKQGKHRFPDEPEPPSLDKEAAANAINIAKLQAMSMADLNQMAKDMGIENFGTMKKHEVIFQILQKKRRTQRHPVFRRGAGDPDRKVLGFFVPRASITFPVRKTFTFRPRRSGDLTYRPATWSRVRSGRLRKRSSSRPSESRGSRKRRPG